MLQQHQRLTLQDHAIIAPVKVHPQAAESERQTKALCEQFGIALPNIDEYNSMTAFMYPSASFDRLVTIPCKVLTRLIWSCGVLTARSHKRSFAGR